MSSTPFSYRQYPGNGATTVFSVPFPYLLKAHVKVFLGYDLLDGTFSAQLLDGADFNWASATQIQLTTAPTTGQTVTVIRQTPTETQVVGWQDGSNLIADDLDAADKQNLYVVQEQADRTALAVAAASDALSELTDLTTYGENYLGALASDPAAKPGGGDIQEGNLYYNTATNRFRVFGDGLWSDGAAPTTLFRWKKVATGGETSLSGDDDNAQSLAYTADFEQVYVNGSLLVRGVDYVAINGTTITGLTALTAGDVVEVISFNAFTIGVAPTEVDFTGLTAANQPIADSDLFLLRQGASNKKVTAAVFRTELASDAQAAQAAAETAKAGAETAKAGAETAKAGAETAKAGAELAQANAESARDDALLNSGVFPSVAAGLAATAVGGYFKTASGNANDFLELYRVDAGPVAVLVSTYPSRAFFSYLESDAGYGESYLQAWVDFNNRLSMGIRPDGTVRIEKGDIGTLSASQITAPGGSIDLDSVDTPQVNITNASSTTGEPNYSEFYSLAILDNSGRIGLSLSRDGTLQIPKKASLGQNLFEEETIYGQEYSYAIVDQVGRIALAVTNSGALYTPAAQSLPSTGIAHGASGTYSVITDAYGRAQIQAGQDSGVSVLTSSGNNWGPAVTSESPERITFQSDRTSGVRYWVMNSDGTRQAPATPNINDITFWGDSMTQRLQSYAHLPGLLSGRTITYNALGGTSIEHIIARQGGENATCTIPSGSIPSSGSVALQNVWPTLGYHAGTLSIGATYSYRVLIAGVEGTLTSTTNASSQADYTFTRTSAGTAVSTTGPVEIIVLSNITQGSFGFSKSNTAVFWMGTNPLSKLPSTTYDPNSGSGIYYKSPATTYDPTNSAAVQSRTEQITQALLNRVENLDRHVLITGPFIGQGQVWASSVEKQAIVAGFATFSKHWYDLRSDFIADCKSWLQTNHPAVYTNWATTDDDHVANGAAPPILREDGIHLNTYGTELVSQLITSKLSSKQW